ncbi:MAG: hypothetical protein K0R65_3080 [Crocinitomicaceae bacterium]|jgi:TatD DNase family protein|nr:hypothetical protein [Crocinitomicaceae bacterium]
MLFNFHTHFQGNKGPEILNLTPDELQEAPFYSLGIHPWKADKWIDFEDLISDKRCLAIGETGLDKLSETPFEQQQDIFRRQVDLSEKYELPLILHCVKAWNEVRKIKTEMQPKQTWIYHGFRKTALLEEVLREGLMIGIGPAIFHDEKLQEALKQIPAERILLETDDMEDADISTIYAKAAEIKQLSLPLFTKQAGQNFRETFKRWGIG